MYYDIQSYGEWYVPVEPEWVKIDRYDPDLASTNWMTDAPKSAEYRNTVTGLLPLDREGTWTYLVYGLDDLAYRDKAHRQRLSVPAGATYTRKTPIVTQADPDPAKDPSVRLPSVQIPDTGNGNEYVFDETLYAQPEPSPPVWLGELVIPGIANVDAAWPDGGEVASETDWNILKGVKQPGGTYMWSPTSLSCQIPRLYPSTDEAGRVQARSGYSEAASRLGLISDCLPDSNEAFGDYRIAVTGGGHVTAEEPSQAWFQVFYAAHGCAHPVPGPAAYCCYDTSCLTFLTDQPFLPTPNWFYYYWRLFPTDALWRVDYFDDQAHFASPVVFPVRQSEVRCDMTYFAHPDGWYYPGTDHIHICSIGGIDARAYVYNAATLQWEEAAHTDQTDDSLRVESAVYIDGFWHVAAHEFAHKWVHESFAQLIEAAEADGDEHDDECDDPDNDGLPTTWEEHHGFNPNLADTVLEGGQYPKACDDQELLCIMAERGKLGPGDKDWAWPGWNMGNDCPDDPAARLTPDSTYSER